MAAAKPLQALVLALAVVGAALLVCGALAMFGVGSTLVLSVTEKDDARQVLEQYMQHMAAKNPDAAYRLFSSRSRQQTAVSELRARASTGYSAFGGYHALEVVGFTVTRSVNTDRSVPQGTVATVHGKVTYAGGAEGLMQAVLEKETGRWMIHDVRVARQAPRRGSGSGSGSETR